MNTKPSSKRRSGIGLVEMMVTVAIGSLLLMVIANFMVYSARSFASMANYADLEYMSRNSLDRLTWRIRQTTRLLEFTETALTFADGEDGSKRLYVRYNPTEKTLHLVDEQDTLLLKNCCTALKFEIFQRNTINGSYDQYPATTDPTLCKVVRVSWTCSKQLYGTRLLNTEIVQTAKIVIRKR